MSPVSPFLSVNISPNDKPNMKLLVLFSLSGVLLLAGCTSPVKRTDPTDPTVQTFRLGQADVNELVQSMVDSMLSSRNVARITGSDTAPTIVVIPFRLDTATITDTRINTGAIGTLVREQILNSGLFRFVDATRRADIAAEVEYQQESGMVDSTKAAQRARQLGANYILEGSISGFDDRSDRSRSVGYVVSMTLQNIETAEIIWQKTDQIAKTQTRGLFGR